MPPAPPAPPTRTTDEDYHFHTYDYQDSQPFTAVPLREYRYEPFYSLLQDLRGLEDAGRQRLVPRIALAYYGSPIAADGKTWHTLALRFGPAVGVPNAPAVVITGGIHAREWISPEMAYLLAEYLIINYKPGPLQNLNYYQKRIRNLVDSRQIHIIPMLNPAGNCHTVFTPGADPAPRLWRKNRFPLPTTAQKWMDALTGQDGRPNPPFSGVKTTMSGDVVYDVPDYDPDHKIPPGPAVYQAGGLAMSQTGVDLNRNCTTTAWGYDCETGKDDKGQGGAREMHKPEKDCYFGPARGSETETGNIQGYLQNQVQGLATAIDYHSFGQFILYPTEVFNVGAVGLEQGLLGSVLRRLTRYPDAPDYRLGTPRQLVGYHATGTIADHIAQHYQARAFTIELDPSPPVDDDARFELPETEIRMVFERNIRGALAAIAAPSLGTTWLGTMRGRRTIGLTGREFLGWNVYGHGNQLPA